MPIIINRSLEQQLFSFLLRYNISNVCTPIPEDLLDAEIILATVANPEFENHPFKQAAVEVGNGKRNIILKAYFDRATYDDANKNATGMSEPTFVRMRELLKYSRENIYGIEIYYSEIGKTNSLQFTFMDVERFYDFMIDGAQIAVSPITWLREHRVDRNDLSEKHFESTRILSEEELEYISSSISDLDLNAKVDVYFAERKGPSGADITTLIDIEYQGVVSSHDRKLLKAKVDMLSTFYKGANIMCNENSAMTVPLSGELSGLPF